MSRPEQVLLDTHTFLWFIFDDPRLSSQADSIIAAQDTRKLLSVASLWEITIKVQLGKLELGLALEVFFRRFVGQRLIEVVGIRLPDLVTYGGLPLLHRDPFDRLVIAQARTLEVPIVTADSRFEPYGVSVLW